MFHFDSYFFNPYAIPNIVVSTLILIVGLFVFCQNRKNPSNIFFFLFCLSLNLWLYGRALMYCSRQSETALLWAKFFAKLGVVYIAPLVYTFSVYWLGLYRQQKKFVIAGFFTAAIFYIAILATPYGILGVRRYFWGYYPVYGPVCRLFLAFFFGYFLAAFRNFFMEWRKAKDPVRHQQIKIVTIAYLISFLGSVDFIPKLVNFPFYPFGYLCVFVWTLVLAYAIVRYRIMDIQTVIHKTLMWLLTSAILGAPLVIVSYVAKDWLFHLPPAAFFAVLSILFVLFALYTRNIQPRIDHLFQRRQWDLMRALEKFTDELVHLKSLDEVISHILNTVRKVFYVDEVSLLIRKGENNYFTVVHFTQVITPNAYGMQHEFLNWLEKNDKVVIDEYLAIDPRMEKIADSAHAYFQKIGAVICVPMVINQKLIGVLNIGKKQNLQPYRSAEINFLSDLRRSAAIALSNSLHLIAMQESLRRWNEELEKKVQERTQQLRETQAQLVQAEKMATLGTLAGGVAHEINNPLTAVLTNAQILKMTANQDDLESISLIEEGAKRCQIIIQKLMKYTRKPAGVESLGRVDVNQVVSNTMAFLGYQLKQENIELIVNKSQRSLIVEGDANELEQLLTNLILNAKDAVKMADRSGRIEVKTSEWNGSVGIIVSDNGAGIPKENLGKIFDPFFTTKEVGKGTGLGLAVAYGIVQKHKGRIEVNSICGEGATFTISFPEKNRMKGGS